MKLYNTKSKAIEDLVPLKEGVISLYACGPTVYDKTHIGHMRKYIGDDLLRRTLTAFGYKVTHVMNITDVGHLSDDGDSGEDKLEKGAQKEGKSVWDIAKSYTTQFEETMKAVGVLPPSIEPKATDHVPDMIILIQKLFEKGFAYETAQAVYFEVSKDKAYGSLSGQKLSEKEVGVRDEVVEDSEKRNPADFALWFKRVGKFKDHTMHWPSPWGDGFPGWHIECSAMSMKYLGETIDIHTGGIDHIPVHHENEIAQSECATGHEFVRCWVHHAFLTVDGEKMSKSKNNFYTLEDIIARGIDPLAVRLLCMQTSYRKPLNFTWEALENAETQLKKIRKFARLQTKVGAVLPFYGAKFKEALSSDLNTAVALSVVWELLDDKASPSEDLWATLLDFDKVLGLGLEKVQKKVISDEAKVLVEKRDAARAAKDFTLSDSLRKELETLGYEVSDTPNGTMLS